MFLWPKERPTHQRKKTPTICWLYSSSSRFRWHTRLLLPPQCWHLVNQKLYVQPTQTGIWQTPQWLSECASHNGGATSKGWQNTIRLVWLRLHVAGHQFTHPLADRTKHSHKKTYAGRIRSAKHNATVWHPSVCLSHRHTHHDSPVGSMLCGQNTFRPDNMEDILVSELNTRLQKSFNNKCF